MNQCWAYSTELDRCDREAGHDGPHSYTITWADEEVHIPASRDNDWVHPEGGLVEVPVLNVQMREDKPVTAATTKTAPKCFACNHKWHTSTCPVVRDDLECGCSKALA